LRRAHLDDCPQGSFGSLVHFCLPPIRPQERGGPADDADGDMREHKIEGRPAVLGKRDRPERRNRNADIETEPRDGRNRS